MALKKIEKLSEDIFILKDHKVLVEFPEGTRNTEQVFAQSSTLSKTADKIATYEVAKWGLNNQRPLEILQLVKDNHLKSQLLRTERDFLMGIGLGLYSKKNGKPDFSSPVEDSEIYEWAEMVKLDDYWFKACSNFVYFSNIIHYAQVDSKSKKITVLDVIDCDQARKNIIRKNILPEFYIHPNWVSPQKSEIKVIKPFDPQKTQLEFCHWTMEAVPGQRYYSYPAWWGTENWTKISNRIPAFHISGIDNGYNIKYHVKIPFNIIQKMTQNSEDPDAVQKAKAELTEEMDKWLAGKDNVNKALVTFTVLDDMGKEMRGIQVESLDNKNTDEQYIKLDDHANINQASGHGVDPSLAGIDTGRGLGKSGKELQITYETHIALRTPQPRQKCLEFLNKIVIPFMGWQNKNVIFGVEDAKIASQIIAQPLTN